jgi:hypothetical protein
MRLERGQGWCYIDQMCGAEIHVKELGAITNGSNPRCSCGNIVKMPVPKRNFDVSKQPRTYNAFCSNLLSGFASRQRGSPRGRTPRRSLSRSGNWQRRVNK